MHTTRGAITPHFILPRKPPNTRVTHDGALDCSTCDRGIDDHGCGAGGRHPSGCTRVDDDDDDNDDDDGEDDEDEEEDNDEEDEDDVPQTRVMKILTPTSM